MRDVEEYKKKGGKVLFESSEFIIIRDKFPKAKHHYLAIPFKDINKISLAKPEDVELIQKMRDEAIKFVGSVSEEDTEFKLGFHAIPSLDRLHLHIISQDFDSECLKHAKHWNSFNTEFFIEVDLAIRELKEKGRMEVNNEKFHSLEMSKQMKCNRCQEMFSNITKLKSHLKTHRQIN